jgi:hypothetical protein
MFHLSSEQLVLIPQTLQHHILGDENKNDTPHVCLLTIQPPDAALNLRKFYCVMKLLGNFHVGPIHKFDHIHAQFI